MFKINCEKGCQTPAVASNSSVYALMYGEDATLASKAIFMTSVACVVTIPLVFIIHTI